MAHDKRLSDLNRSPKRGKRIGFMILFTRTNPRKASREAEEKARSGKKSHHGPANGLGLAAVKGGARSEREREEK